MIRRRRPQACLAAVRPVCVLILLTHLSAPSHGQFEDFPLPGDLGEPAGTLEGLDVRTLDLLETSEAARAETDALLESLADPFAIDHLIIGTKLMLRGEPGALGRIESVLVDLGVVEERHACATVPLYYVRDADSIKAMLSEVAQSASALDEVSVTASSAYDAQPALVLYGPRSQVEDLRRVIAAIDVPHPEVRLDIWAFQISGSNATRVAHRAQKADECIRAVAHLIRGYLHGLENCALDEQQRNETPDYTVFGLVDGAEADSTDSPIAGGAARGSGEAWGGVAGLFSRLAIGSGPPETIPMDVTTPGPAGVPPVAMGVIPTAKRRVAVVPSARGPHPLSLTETLATLILIRPRAGSVEATLEGDLRRHLADWLGGQDARSLATWHRLLERSGVAGDDERFARLLDVLQGAIEAQGGRPEEKREPRAVDKATKALLPARLLETFREEAYVDVAQATLSGFLLDWKANATDWRSLPPDRLSNRAADARMVLQGAEHALAEDIRSLFLDPLVNELRGLASQGGRDGLAEASNTSISVLSGTRAEVVGSAISYFDVSVPREPDVSVLMPGGQLPEVLAGTLRDHRAVWSVLTSGAELSVTPHVLPGGGAAELEITLTVNHEDHEVATEGMARGVAPLSRVAQHKAETKVYVNSLDVSGLSSLSLRTSQPRADLAVPLLSRLPLLGEVFRFPRSPNRVHHASMLLIVSTILPTGMDLGTTLDFEPYEKGT